jgi:ABC-2 type transport system ATP-binding protein
LQINLGEKKIEELTLDKPFDAETVGMSDDIKIIEQKSPLELTLEVDMAKVAISKFIETVSRRFSFSDIAIKELPMEKIIMQIYNETEKENNEKYK